MISLHPSLLEILAMTRTSNPLLRQTWQTRIDAQPMSGLNVAQFCAQQGCSVANFYCWKRKLAQSGSAEQQVGHAQDTSLNPFVQLNTAPRIAADKGVELMLPGGTIARIPLDPMLAMELILRYAAPLAKA